MPCFIRKIVCPPLILKERMGVFCQLEGRLLYESRSHSSLKFSTDIRIMRELPHAQDTN